jgi:hypothetical protein
MTLTARPTKRSDLPVLAKILNHTIRMGGTTAHEDEMSVEDLQQHYFDAPEIVTTVLNDETPIGFQAVFATDEGLAIGSFTDQRNPVRGAGAVMFAATKAAAIESGKYKWIDAKIRADNVPGLAYYSKMGFEDFTVDEGVPLKDGTPMDRITKRLML